MKFIEPTWLLLLPALVFLGWQWPRLELRRPLRGLCLVLLALALADLSWRIYEPGIDLWVLVDRSDSAADLLAPRLGEWDGLLRKSMGANDRLKYIDFGEDAVVRPEDLNTASEINPSETRVANALRLAVLHHDPSRATRFLLLSDGYPTEPLLDVGELLDRANIPLDMRLVALNGGTDFEVASLQAPNRVQVGEPFVLDVQLRVDGAVAASVPYQLERDGVAVAKGTANFQNGQARLRLTDRLEKSGSAHYTVRIFPTNDPVPGNNAAETWVESVAGPRVLLVSAYPDDPVAATLKAQGIDVDLETNPATLHEGRLSGARAIIFDNVPAHLVPGDFLKAVDFFVRDQGGGLLMLGGKNSFGSGGYYGSRLDPLLPVSMELKDEKHKLSVAMAIALDRSGSMRASVPNSSGGVSEKIDLADAGTAEAIRQLGPKDLVSVFAIDTQAYTIVPLGPVEPDRQTMIDNVLRITSQGGGIVVPVALRASWNEIKDSKAGQKHIIIFADANDALQQSGGMPEIVKDITDGNGTVSVIGLGHDYDSGADYLRDVARLGNGRIFFSADANDLPAIFTQETVAVARSSFITDPTPLQSTSGWAELAAQSLSWTNSVDGYNLCYLQPKAGQAAVTGDENAAPLVAFWQRGSGRAAAVTFPLAGAKSDTVRAWPGYGDFVTTLTRWLMGTDAPDGLGVKTSLDGDELTVDLLYDQKWDAEIAKNFPSAVYTQNGFEQRQSLNWDRLEPGHFQSQVRLKPGQPAVGAVQVGQYSMPFGPLAPGADLEWLRDPAGPRALRALVAGSGGREITELPEAWRDIGRQYYRSLRPWILSLLALAVIAEALATRLGVLASWRRSEPKHPA
jgi:hypothetical protein